MNLLALDAAIDRGLADAEAGRVKPIDEVFDRLEAKYRGLIKSTDQGANQIKRSHDPD